MDLGTVHALLPHDGMHSVCYFIDARITNLEKRTVEMGPGRLAPGFHDGCQCSYPNFADEQAGVEQCLFSNGK